jgi:protein TonB
MHREPYTFSHWLAISVAIHAAVILSFFLPTLHMPAKSANNKLAIELFGMVADRQQEEKRRAGLPEPVMPKQRAPRQQAKRPEPKQPDEIRTMTAETPVREEKGDEIMSPEQASRAVFIPASPAAGSGGTSDADQRRQMIRFGSQATDRITAYTTWLIKRLRANLVYPEEVRMRGVEGITTLVFTITAAGDLKGGSLRVRKSSGYPGLDASALRAVRVSAPFEKPPRELTVSVPVRFEVETTRLKAKQVSAR